VGDRRSRAEELEVLLREGPHFRSLEITLPSQGKKLRSSRFS
jgi:hypothetical protein